MHKCNQSTFCKRIAYIFAYNIYIYIYWHIRVFMLYNYII